MKKACFIFLSFFLSVVTCVLFALFVELSIIFASSSVAIFSHFASLKLLAFLGVIFAIALITFLAFILNYKIISENNLERIITVETLAFMFAFFPLWSAWEKLITPLLKVVL